LEPPRPASAPAIITPATISNTITMIAVTGSSTAQARRARPSRNAKPTTARRPAAVSAAIKIIVMSLEQSSRLTSG
jgi:hypothetical protein